MRWGRRVDDLQCSVSAAAWSLMLRLPLLRLPLLRCLRAKNQIQMTPQKSTATVTIPAVSVPLPLPSSSLALLL